MIYILNIKINNNILNMKKNIYNSFLIIINFLKSKCFILLLF